MMTDTLAQVLEIAKGLCYQDTSMALDLICEELCYNHDIDAKWSGRSIYVGDQRVASIEVSREYKGCVGIYRYKIMEAKK